MAQGIDANWVKLAEDAFDQTAINFSKAVNVIDEKFGNGYANSHPELLGAFLQAVSTEYNGTTIGACVQDLEKGLNNIAERIGCAAEIISH
jgi:hypothetical protein